MSLSKIAHGLSKISHKSVFSWKSACKNTLQRSFSYSVSSKSVSGHLQKLQVVDLAILVLINALQHLVQLLIGQVVAEARDYLLQLVGCYETVVVLDKRLESLKMIMITLMVIMKPCQRP